MSRDKRAKLQKSRKVVGYKHNSKNKGRGKTDKKRKNKHGGTGRR